MGARAPQQVANLKLQCACEHACEQDCFSGRGVGEEMWPTEVLAVCCVLPVRRGPAGLHLITCLPELALPLPAPPGAGRTREPVRAGAAGALLPAAGLPRQGAWAGATGIGLGAGGAVGRVVVSERKNAFAEEDGPWWDWVQQWAQQGEIHHQSPRRRPLRVGPPAGSAGAGAGRHRHCAG